MFFKVVSNKLYDGHLRSLTDDACYGKKLYNSNSPWLVVITREIKTSI